MSKGSPHFQKLKQGFIFPLIDKKLEEMRHKHPHNKILNFGVGDIVFPLKPPIVEALVAAVQEMGTITRGYGPSVGYPFLRQAIVDSEYGKYGIKPSEIFISEGTKADSVNLLDVFDHKCRIGLQDPTYPSYLDGCVIDGRTERAKKNGLYSDITYLPCTEDNHFVPSFPSSPCDVIYLCSPNNPTGIALTKTQLQEWVAYAKKNHIVLILDAAYEAFITSPDVPHSIYEIPGAHEVAIELKSFSKSAGFTGLRCAYSVIPDALNVTVKNIHQKTQKNTSISLNTLWVQRQNIKTNGVAYPIQKAAAVSLKKSVQAETQKDIQLYLSQGRRFKEALLSLGHTCYGGVDCPYIWWKVPQGRSSWEFCDDLLHRLNILTIPGSAFGLCGEGFVRLSTFALPSDVEEALCRLKKL